MNIYAVDVDDTLEGCGGPVQLEKLYWLKQRGHVIGLCGNWAKAVAVVGGWATLFSFFGPWDGNKVSMLSSIKQYVRADRYIMVGNIAPSPDMASAAAAGWEFIEEKYFGMHQP